MARLQAMGIAKLIDSTLRFVTLYKRACIGKLLLFDNTNPFDLSGEFRIYIIQTRMNKSNVLVGTP